MAGIAGHEIATLDVYGEPRLERLQGGLEHILQIVERGCGMAQSFGEADAVQWSDRPLRPTAHHALQKIFESRLEGRFVGIDDTGTLQVTLTFT